MKRIHLLVLLFVLSFFAAAQKSNLWHSAGITLYNWKWIPEMPLVPSSVGADKFRFKGLNYAEKKITTQSTLPLSDVSLRKN